MNTLKAISVSKRYKNVVALNNVTLNFEESQITGVIGPNGSGKTTLLCILSGLMTNYEGELRNNDLKLENRKHKFQVAFLSEEKDERESSKSIKYLLYLATLYEIPKKQALDKIAKLSKEFEVDKYLNFPIKKLSKGNWQKIKLISCFLNPKLKYLLLDEPFDGIDPWISQKIIKYLSAHKSGLHIVITTHRMDIVNAVCDKYYILKFGQLISENTSKIDISKLPDLVGLAAKQTS